VRTIAQRTSRSPLIECCEPSFSSALFLTGESVCLMRALVPAVLCARHRYNLFLEMMAQIRRNVIYNVYMFQPQRVVDADKAKQPEPAAAA
jgi:hypothetical protein